MKINKIIVGLSALLLMIAGQSAHGMLKKHDKPKQPCYESLQYYSGGTQFSLVKLSFFAGSKLHVFGECVDLCTLERCFWTNANNIKCLISADKYTLMRVDSKGITLQCGNSTKVELLHSKSDYDDLFTHEWHVLIGKTYIASQVFMPTRITPCYLKLEIKK